MLAWHFNQGSTCFLRADDPFERAAAVAAANRRNWLLSHASKAQRFLNERDDALFLEGALTALHVSSLIGDEPIGWIFSKNELETLEVLARHTWRQMPGELTDAMLDRIQREFAADQSPQVEDYKAFSAQVKAIVGDESCLWQSKRDQWLPLVKAVIESKTEMGHVSSWRRRIEADPGNATLYRQGYRAVVHVLRPGEVDFEFLKPLLVEDPKHALRQLMWKARVLGTLAVANVPVADPDRTELREHFIRDLRLHDLRFEDLVNENVALWIALCDLYRVGDPAKEARPLLDVFMESNDVRALSCFVDGLDLSPRNRFELMLGKPTAVEFIDRPLNEALEELKGLTPVAIWVSQKVNHDTRPISLRTKGPWLMVLELLLEDTEYLPVQLLNGMVLIGKPEERSAVERALAKARLKTSIGNRCLDDALYEMTTLDYSKLPLSDAIDYLGERHGVQIELLGGDAAKPITMQVTSFPLTLVLSLLAEEIDGDWGIFEDVIVIGSADDVKSLRRIAEQNLRRSIRLKQMDAQVTAALEAKADCDVRDTPLEEVVRDLAGKYDVPVELAEDSKDKHRVSFSMAGIKLSTMLDLLLIKHKLAWETDSKVIFIGNEEAVENFRRVHIMR